MEIATHLPVSIFNSGFISILTMMVLIGRKIGSAAHAFVINRDQNRLQRSGKRASEASKTARIAKKNAVDEQFEFFENAEGPLYGSGIDD